MDRNEIVNKVAQQVRRSLDDERAAGASFPDKCRLGVRVLAAGEFGYTVNVRLDGLSIEVNVATMDARTEAHDIMRPIDMLVRQWLARRKNPP